MFILLRYFFVFLFFKTGALFALDLAGEQIYVREVFPLFNVHESALYISSSQKGINPAVISIPNNVKLAAVTGRLGAEGLIGDTIFKDLILKVGKNHLDVEINIHNANPEIKITPRLVSNWYQAGFTTTQKKVGGVLTYELLLNNDKNLVIEDRWIKNKNGGWVYVPPVIKFNDSLNTTLSSDSYKRLLLKISLGQNVLPGEHGADLEIITYQNNSKQSVLLPITIKVLPVRLTTDDQNKYKLLLYTAFKLNDQIDRPGSYTNAMRFFGSEKEKEDLLFAYLTDIKEHGFNGITIRDWNSDSLENMLKLTSKVGFKYVVLHATTPVNNKYKDKPPAIVSDYVKSIFDKYDTNLYYYGYDEIGGNKLLDKQLTLNQDIHTVGGQSVNAVFWDDMDTAINKIKNDESKCFDVMAHSMGSHGQIEMFKSLPYVSRDDYCSKQGTEHLTYWHPHVENPVINRIFSGFWLWASGFDGVIPHGYYFPSHIEKVISKDDLKSGVSKAASPYDDWSFWLPGDPLRHHNSVYPSKNGPIGTLQWEGVLSGNVDLKYVLTLESKLDDDSLNKNYKEKILTLLSEIRGDILQIKSPYMSDKDSIKYLKKLEVWKKTISSLLLH